MAESKNPAISTQNSGNPLTGDASSGASGFVPQGGGGGGDATNSGYSERIPMTMDNDTNHDNDRLQNVIKSHRQEDPNANLQPGNAHHSPEGGRSSLPKELHQSLSRSKSPNPKSPNCLPGDDTPARPSRRQYTQKSRTEMSTLWKEREERVRKVKEQQEEERRRKAEEWQHQALMAQKFREQQEYERKKAMLDARAKDAERRNQIEERRKALEKADRERREALMKRNLEREERLDSRRKSSAKLTFAFGSSTPRMVEPGEPGAKRSTSSSNVHGNLMTQSMYVRRSAERETPDGRLKSDGKKSTSVYGLDKSGNDGDSDLMTQSFHTGFPAGRSGPPAHRRRTDIYPTITPSSAGSQAQSRDLSRASTPGRKMLHSKSPGLSREGTASSRLSTTPSTESRPAVRLRNNVSRKPRPASIAVSGMSQSTYEKRPSGVPSGASTPTNPRQTKNPDLKKKDKEDDGKSMASHKTPNRKTPAQVKALSAAKKSMKVAKSLSVTNASKPKSPVSESPIVTVTDSDDDPDPVVKREVTPDILSKSDKPNQDPDVTENTDNSASESQEPEVEKKPEEKPAEDPEEVVGTSVKKIITSEEEAKARIAEKRREMKEKMEREAELERLRLAEEERLEQERLAREEEEEKKAVEEAEKLAAEARRAEEERLQKAIEEAQRREEEERKRKEEEERLKQEAEAKAREEAQRKQLELEDKLRKEEEARQARKKRIEEIMARTRGGNKGNSSPSNTPTKSGSGDEKTPELLKRELVVDSNGDSGTEPTNNNSIEVPVDHAAKPDIIGDINGEKAQEKPLLDDFDPFPSAKDQPEQGDQVKGTTDQMFDQILDLSSETTIKPNDQESQNSVIIGAPIIAFEDANSGLSAKQEVPTGDLLS